MSVPPGIVPAMVSGEGVPLALHHAGIGSRIVSTLIDFAIQFAGGIVLVLASAALGRNADPAAVGAVLIGEVVLIIAGYPVLSEWLGHGRTPGKAALGLRVVRDDGGPIAFRHALVRGLASLILEKPGLFFPLTTAAGLFVALFGARSKRLGDLLAGSVVIYERAGPRRAAVPQHFSVPYPLGGWAQALDLSGLDDGLALAVRQFVVRASQLTPEAAHQLGEALRARVEQVITPPAPPGTPTPWVLTTVLAERRRRAELAARPTQPPSSVQWPASGSAPGPTPPPPQSRPPSPGGPGFAPPG